MDNFHLENSLAYGGPFPPVDNSAQPSCDSMPARVWSTNPLLTCDVNSDHSEAIGQRLVRGIAHDFNNQLMVIRGQLEYALLDLTTDENTRSRLVAAEQAAIKATNLSSQLLTFGRIQGGQKKNVNLNVIIANAGSRLARLAGDTIALTIDTETTLHDIYADPAQVERILMNLVLLAKAAMPQGGQLKISTFNSSGSRVGAEPVMECVVLEVSDTGRGLTTGEIAQVSDPSFTEKSLACGAGLGLFEVYSIVQHSQGHIAFETEPGRGTKFSVALPGLATVRPEPASQLVARIQEGTETILLAEDEPGIRNLFSSALTRLGYRVLAAEDGREAMRIAESTPGIDLLITDLLMPNMDGRQLAEAMQGRMPELRVIFMSGFAGGIAELSPSAERVLLRKPFSVRELASQVRTLLDRQIDSSAARTSLSRGASAGN